MHIPVRAVPGQVGTGRIRKALQTMSSGTSFVEQNAARPSYPFRVAFNTFRIGRFGRFCLGWHAAGILASAILLTSPIKDA